MNPLARVISGPVRRVVLLAALILLGLVAGSSTAAAGTFTVESCQGAAGFSTAAFDNFATRGMVTKRACRPRGPGLRGMTVAVKPQKAHVEYGSTARFVLTAPPGTVIVRASWSGARVRSDCGYTIDVYAQGGKSLWPFGKTRTAGHNCPPKGRAQTADVDGGTRANISATRIVQRIICARKACSARGRNYLKTSRMTVTLADITPPTVAITGGSLVAGDWVKGSGESVSYSATDNTGIRSSRVVAADGEGTESDQTCVFVTAEPCVRTVSSTLNLDTGRAPEGTSQVRVRADDASGNVGYSDPRLIHIDRTPPARVDPAEDGGEGWRNTPAFGFTWSNPPEPDRAPITAASYRLCPNSDSGDCTTDRVAGGDIAHLALQPPRPGEWSLRMWREDAAGNSDPDQASAPVVLRYDPTPPVLAFADSSAQDPTRLAVNASDEVSGIATSGIELSRQGSGTWQVVPSSLQGGQIVAQVDDSALPAGRYDVRARAADQAGNERSISGKTITLPLRTASVLLAGIKHSKTVRRVVRRHGRRRHVRRQVTVFKPSGRVRLGRHLTVGGRLTDHDGNGIAGDVAVYEEAENTPRHLLGTVRADSRGRFSYRAVGSQSRSLSFVYQGTRTVLPASRQVKVVVPATSTMRASRRRLLNGQRLTFSGRVRSLPIPAAGKLVTIQVRLYTGRRARWSTFRTTHTDAHGNWAVPYRFTNTCERLKTWRLRAALPAEAGSPFASGHSRAVRVKVRGNGRC